MNSKNQQPQTGERGFILITTLFLMALVLSMIGAYTTLSRFEIQSSRFSRDSTRSFYRAEAGLNIRAENIRQTFVGYNRPSGSSPSTAAPCTGGDNGSGDFACDSTTLSGHNVVHYVNEEPGNPLILTIPPGERYQTLNAQEYRYTAASISKNLDSSDGARLELRFKSRLVPLFQFAAFYDKDLEILPGANMTLSGPVHTNGDLYLNSDATLQISGQVTTSGTLYRGRKNTTVSIGTVQIRDPVTYRNLCQTCGTRTAMTAGHISQYNNMVQTNVEPVEVPAPEEFDPAAGKYYWDKADLRLVLNLTTGNVPVITNASTGVEIRNADDTVDMTRTPKLTACAGSIGGRVANNTLTFRDNREAKVMRMLDVDLQALLNCIQSQNLLESSRLLNDNSEGGLVFYFTVKGPDQAIPNNNYGFRVRNATEIRSTVGGAPTPIGLSIISDQAAYTIGNFNSVNKKPAAIMADTVNILSGAWSNDANSNNSLTGGTRNPTDTTVNAAFLAGTDTTGSVEGSGGQNGAYNGGLENYPRMHENWSGRTLTYQGSFVSLGRPRHKNGAWVYGAPVYNAPVRAWTYDTSFNNAANLPPITPRFVYLRQELFVRDWGE